MNSVDPNIRLQKRLLQFNNLVFPFGGVITSSYTSSFKGESVDYMNALHGSYYPNFTSWGKLQSSEFEAEITLDFSILGCEGDYVRYLRFIKRELARPGKLWAVQGGTEIIWTNARVLSINEDIDPTSLDTLHLNIRFELMDGFWNLASATRTFIASYAVCEFVDYDGNYGYYLQEEAGRCNANGNNCMPCNKPVEDNFYPNDTAFKPLCQFSKAELIKMFSKACPEAYFLKYDAELEAKNFCYDVAWGEKKRLSNTGLNYSNSTTFDYYSRSDIPTESVKVTLVGSYENPTITINGRSVTLKGTFEDQVITIGEGANIYVSDDLKNPCANPVSIIDQAEFSGVPYFTINPGKNTVTVSGNEYGKNSAVYIKSSDITY